MNRSANTLVLGVAACLSAWPAVAALRPGAPAPDFSVEAAQGGKTFTFDLASALRKGPVVVYFYPKSFTSTCTLEAHEFADAIPTFQAAGASVIGLSGDSIATQREFSSKECRDTFPVGADAQPRRREILRCGDDDPGHDDRLRRPHVLRDRARRHDPIEPLGRRRRAPHRGCAEVRAGLARGARQLADRPNAPLASGGSGDRRASMLADSGLS